MKNSTKIFIIALIGMLMTGCTRVGTGEVGLRVGFDKQIKESELMPGSFNQELIGDVLLFPVRQIQLDVANLTPIAKDNSTMKDFNIRVIYDINPTSVAQLYSQVSKNFHGSQNDEVILMYNYLSNVVRNAVFKAARKYDALEMNDNRSNIETEVRAIIDDTLEHEKFNDAIKIQQVTVTQILPADIIVASANDLVRAKNQRLQKEIEVQTAQFEAQRIAAINANKGAIEYMNAVSLQNISEGIKAGKVNTIVVPVDFKGMVNVPASPRNQE